MAATVPVVGSSAPHFEQTPSDVNEAEGYLPTPYQQQIHQSKYARWREDLGRRETWPETVQRYMDYIRGHLSERGTPLSEGLYRRLHFAILTQDVLCSMRALMTAGPALKRDEVAAYNCSYIEVNRVEAFDESMYVLMCGTGVGFSVESRHVNKLPIVPSDVKLDHGWTIVVEDSKYGWASALRELITGLYAGRRPVAFDVSKIRPAGAILKTFGGRASGPQPLLDLFDHVIDLFLRARGRRLTDKEAHSIMCKIGDVVVVGGVRRSAEISLSDLASTEMRDSKSGDWFVENPHFGLANNSAVYESKPDWATFNDEWSSLVASGSGERGIFNRRAAQQRVAKYGLRNTNFLFGLNPCGEIILRDRQFCNLSQITVRESDTKEDLQDKCYLATVLGVIQSTFTNFIYLSDEWKKNCEEERLVGVGMTGVMDNPYLNGKASPGDLASLLDELREGVRVTCEEFAKVFDINVPTAATCMKPAGNSTQLVGAHGSGLHAAWSKFYIRRNRGNKNDPVAQFLYYQGVPTEDEKFHPDTTWVFSYPMKAPDSALTRDDFTAIEQLEHWLIFAEHWTEHNPSVTIQVKEHEWPEVGNWVYDHFDRMVGVSFLPFSEHTYEQAPYESITEREYNALAAEMPESLDWSLLSALETADMTTGSQELACVAGSCEV